MLVVKWCVLRCDRGEGAASDELAVRSVWPVEGAGGCGAAPGGGAGVGLVRAGIEALRSIGRSGASVAGVLGRSSSSSITVVTSVAFTRV